jgi:hypothetical protein
MDTLPRCRELILHSLFCKNRKGRKRENKIDTAVKAVIIQVQYLSALSEQE